jgi:hypothetical protein
MIGVDISNIIIYYIKVRNYSTKYGNRELERSLYSGFSGGRLA